MVTLVNKLVVMFFKRDWGEVNVGHPDEPKLQWWWELLNSKGEFCECNISDGNDTYEQAAESAIKYCLENLI